MTDAYDLARQARWETEAFTRAIRSYREAAEHKDWSELSAGQVLLREIVPPLTAIIETAQAEAEASIGAWGRSAEWAWLIQLLPAEKIAVTTLLVVLRAAVGSHRDPTATIIGGAPVTSAAQQIARSLHTQVEYDRWSGASPDDEKRLRRRYPKVDQRTWQKWRKKLDIARDEPWTTVQSTSLGACLISLLCAAAPRRFAVSREARGIQSRNIVAASQETLDTIDDTTARAEVARPLLMPMICPPIPHQYHIVGA